MPIGICESWLLLTHWIYCSLALSPRSIDSCDVACAWGLLPEFQIIEIHLFVFPGGGRGCFKCGEDGHMARDCTSEGSSGGGGFGGGGGGFGGGGGGFGGGSKGELCNRSSASFFSNLGLKARYGGSNMKKINNGCRLLISCMMEGIKKVNLKNGILWLFSVTDPPKIQDGRHI